MLEVLFNATVYVMTVLLSVMPFIAGAITIYLFAVLEADRNRPRNFLLKAIAIDSALVTLGSAWWAFVALRRIFVGSHAPALPRETLLLYGLSLILLMAVPIHKFIVYRRIEKMSDEEALDRGVDKRQPPLL